mmetsp:Transcript_30537/g.37619  ORF Transcript_30537/g.37619 Transcript_30537/m.37619 type:complete len:115 (-) Transcript_30537:458-802(-)
MGEIETDKGVKIQESVVKYSMIPRQIETEFEAEVVDTSGSSSSAATQSLMSSNFVLNVFFAGKMDQIWQLLNSLQVVELVGLFKIKSPGNMNEFNSFFTVITSVKIVDAQKILK